MFMPCMYGIGDFSTVSLLSMIRIPEIIDVQRAKLSLKEKQMI